MTSAIDQFRMNIERVRNLGTIFRALKAQTTEILDLTDILRAELVLAVSALDYYIHEVARQGMLEIYEGRRPHTPAYLRFNVTLESVLQGISAPTSRDWLDAQVRERHGYQSFQHPDKIADAIRLVSEVDLWNEIADRLGLLPPDVKERLKLIILRRQQIAHEADMMPAYPHRRWPINEAEVDDAIEFLEQLAEAVHSIVS